MAQPRPDDGPLLRLLSINVHQGMSAWRRRCVLAEQREANWKAREADAAGE